MRKGRCWIGNPLVEVGTAEGPSLLFFLDTGASQSEFTVDTLETLGADFRPDGGAWSSGIHGPAWQPRVRIARLSLFLDGQALVFTEARREPAALKVTRFPWWAGMLASDLAQAGVLILDFPSARVTFRP